jgi:hydrogenase-4 component B
VHLVLVALGVLLAGAVASLLLGRFARFGLAVALSAVVLASVAAAAGALATLVSAEPAQQLALAWPLPLGQADLALDALSAWFLLTFALIAAPAAVYSWRHLEHDSPRAGSLYGALLCLLVASLMLVVVADNAVLFLVAWEAMTLCAFFLVGFHHERPEVRRAAWLYLVVTHLATGLALVPMFAMLMARGGSDARLSTLAETGAVDPSGAAVLIFLLGLVGFGTKAGFWPFHVWLPHAHPVAPTPISALMSGVVIKTGIYGLLRLVTWLSPLPAGCGVALIVLGSVTGLMGVLLALAQHDLKRLLAYHSVENIGIIGIGIGLGMLGQATGHPMIAALGFAGALLHVLNHALFKGLLFLSAGSVIRATGTGEIDRLGGLAKKTPANAALFLVGAVAICGLPPGNGFVSEWLLFGGLFTGAADLPAGQAAVSVLALTALAMMGGLALACFAKVFGVVFLGEPRDASLAGRATPRSMLGAMAWLALPCLAIGLLPMLVMPLLGPALGVAMSDPTGIDPVLAGMSAALAPISALALLLVAVVAALALLRRAALARAGGSRADLPTWGCAYPAPTPRMAYTSSSFAAPLVRLFGSVLWPRRRFQPPKGIFPAESHLETHATDIAEADFFAPLFAGVRRLALMVQSWSWSGRRVETTAEARDADPADEAAGGPLTALRSSLIAVLRGGTVHLHLALIVLTLVVLFAIEAFSSHGGAP